jgi:hypothetical protein
MRSRLGLLCFLGLLGCGATIDDDSNAAGGNSGSGGRSGAGGSGAGGTVGTGAGGTGGAGAGGGGTAGVAGVSGAGGSTDVPWEVTLDMGPFVVSPGQDTYRCQNFANPFRGVDVEIAEFESHMTTGSHHLVLNSINNATNTGIVSCGGLEIPSGPYATQTRDDKLTYPEGIAAPLSGSEGFRINSHYFNPSTESYEARVTITIRRAKPETVRAQALTTVGIAFNINVAPGSTGSASSSVSLGEEAGLLYLMPHMHMHGTRFVVTDGRENILDVDDWETAPLKYNPPRTVPAGQTLAYKCDYQNDTGQPLTFGEKAANNEMCVLIAQYYRLSDF